MLSFFTGLLRKHPVLVGISRTRLTVTDTETNKAWSQSPRIQFGTSDSSSKKVVAIGDSVTSEIANTTSPFDHPRCIINDFHAAEILVQEALRQVTPGLKRYIRPTVIFYVSEQLEGGLTQIELRALRELMLGAGSRYVYYWPFQSAPSRNQIISQEYKERDSAAFDS